MDWKALFSDPFSRIRSWAASHERFIAVNVTGGLAVVFFIVSAVFLLISLGIL